MSGGSVALDLSYPAAANFDLDRNEQQDRKFKGRNRRNFRFQPCSELAMNMSHKPMAGTDMADTDQVSAPIDRDDTQAAPSGAESTTLGHQAEVVWILGDTLPNNAQAGDSAEMHLPGDSHFVLDAAVFSEAPANLDHALHQLTTATDLFDVPVLDFDSHNS